MLPCKGTVAVAMALAIDRIWRSSYSNLDCKINTNKLFNFLLRANKRMDWIESDRICYSFYSSCQNRKFLIRKFNWTGNNCRCKTRIRFIVWINQRKAVWNSGLGFVLNEALARKNRILVCVISVFFRNVGNCFVGWTQQVAGFGIIITAATTNDKKNWTIYKNDSY